MPKKLVSTCCNELAAELYDPQEDSRDLTKRFRWDGGVGLYDWSTDMHIAVCPYCGDSIGDLTIETENRLYTCWNTLVWLRRERPKLEPDLLTALDRTQAYLVGLQLDLQEEKKAEASGLTDRQTTTNG